MDEFVEAVVAAFFVDEVLATLVGALVDVGAFALVTGAFVDLVEALEVECGAAFVFCVDSTMPGTSVNFASAALALKAQAQRLAITVNVCLKFRFIKIF